MVSIYVNGKKVGSWADAESAFATAARSGSVEFRDEDGSVFATSFPATEPIIPWEPGVTRDELERRKREPGLTFEQVMQRPEWS